ncbi:MAG: PKD domain-containing protein, partial [Bacteroidetes bacterium]
MLLYRQLALLGWLFTSAGLWAQFPQDITDQLVLDGLGAPVGLTFDQTERIYVWTKAGRVILIEDGEKLPDPLIDIGEEVATYGDHGLLGFALHPNFRQNGYFYLLYAVDRHHLLYYGTPDYDPDANLPEAATIGRVCRYTADVATDFTTVVPGSRKVLLGESPGTGIPLLHKSHGVGTLAFGSDGSLLLSCGDGGSYAGTDVGAGSAGSYDAQGLADGIITPAEDVGAFRSQMVDSHSGKILRIDPETGDGLPSNPFYDPARPRAARSRVWALGLRNPFRFTIRPGTGGHSPEEGDPGTLFIGDVGWAYWEEVNVADQGGLNFGWPIFEGMYRRWQYNGRPTPNLTAANPRQGQAGCDLPFFRFQDLLLDATADPAPFFPNPCQPGEAIPTDIPRFVHQRPAITYSNQDWNDEEQGTLVGDFGPDGQGRTFHLEEAGSPVAGLPFTGICNLGGIFYQGRGFPAGYDGQLITADFSGWVRRLTFDPAQQLLRADSLGQTGRPIVALAMHPSDGCIYYLAYGVPGALRRICYGGNAPPQARLDLDQTYGPAPLMVQFSAAESEDPEGASLTYLWEFGDGDSSTEVAPQHTFTATSDQPASFWVRLTVRDTGNLAHQVWETVSVNNTPPEAAISSFADGDRYTTTGPTLLPLQAEATDAEHSPGALSYRWEVFFHHNTHFHPEPPDTARESAVWLAAEGCGEEDYWYRVRLTVTDGAGLSATDEAELFPYCGPAQTVFDTVWAEVRAGQAYVHWQTVEETVGSHFRIASSPDGRHFTPGPETLAGAEDRDYVLSQPAPGPAPLFYRIEVIGPDGYQDFSRVVEA